MTESRITGHRLAVTEARTLANLDQACVVIALSRRHIMVRIGVIVGSTRPGRFGIQPANWIFGLAQQRGGADFELVDLEEVGLPLLDEPIPPAMHQYQNEHTKR
jgi:hypothetical protein